MSFNEYVAHGWSLCGIDAGKKAPTYENWNDADKALTELEAEGADGAGLMHALSGTCALDIDNIDLARPYLAERGVDVDALLDAPEAVKISSGRAGRAKLLYKMKLPMRTLKPKESGLELRCATADGKSVQDVLPPTIHPDTKKPYAWAYNDTMFGHWSNPPPIPANLLAVWRSIAAETPVDKKAPQAPKADASIATIKKAIHHYINSKHKDVTNYEDWIDVGMRLHDQTGGAQEGLEIWDEWSATDDSKRKDGGPRYEGIEALELHWRSFKSDSGKSVVGMSHVVAQMPAEVSEFEVEPEVDEAESTAAKLKKQAEVKKAEAQAVLEKRLVYVRNIARYFDTERHAIILTDSDLQHQFAHMMPKGKGGSRVDPVAMLKNSATKRYVDGLAFHPGEGATFDFDGDRYANTYRNRLPEPIEPTAEELEKIAWIFERITDIPYREWLVQYYAHVVQHPGVKIRSAPLIWSEEEGNGKSTLTGKIPQLLVGRNYSKEVTFDQLNDSFTGFMVDTWHVSLKEFRAGTRGERDRITKKTEIWIADDTIPVRAMHQVAYTIPNHCFVTASTNADDAATLSNNNRKWAIHELRAKQMTSAQVRWIYHDFLLTPRAAGVLRHYFLNQPIVDFTPDAAAPVTEDRRAMIDASAAADVEVLDSAINARTGLFARDVVLIPEVTEWLQKNSLAKPTMHRVGKLLAKHGGQVRQIRVGESRYRVCTLRNHAKWDNESGKTVMDHIEGLDDDASTEPAIEELSDQELLA